MVITINVNVTGLDNFAAVFAKLTAPAQEMKVQVLPTAPTQSVEALPEPSKKSRNTRTTTPNVQESDPAPEPEPDTVTEIIAEEITADAPSVIEIREAAAGKGKTPEGKAAIKKLLAAFESPSISAIPEDKRAAFLAALEDL